MKSVDVASIAELNEILEKSPVTLVDFSARWCGPCKKLLPMLEDLSKEPKMSSVNFIKIDVDDNQEISEVMNVQAMPTIVIFKGTKEVEYIVGANIEKIRVALDQALQQ